MTKDAPLHISSGFLLLSAVLYFTGGLTGLTACLAAATAHELGHLAAICLCGGRIRRIQLTGAGFTLDCDGLTTSAKQGIVLLSGPLSGLLFAFFCLGLPGYFFLYAGTTALLGTFFNLLPIFPLDGGRLAMLLLASVMPEEAAARTLTVTGVILSLLLAVTGISLSVYAITAAGLWLSVLAIRQKF